MLQIQKSNQLKLSNNNTNKATMKKIFTLIATTLLILGYTQAQNDTLYVMKNGVVINKYNVNNDIDSIVFYEPILQTITDIDGNEYPILTIGNQTWMAKNLRTTKFNDGTNIALVTESSIWSNIVSAAYCWYDNDSIANANNYGALYNWYTVETNKLCPTGWHVPSDVEWLELTNYLGGLSIAGGKLKEVGTTHWSCPNAEATNETGFNALSGGAIPYYGGSLNMGLLGTWWSTTKINNYTAWGWLIDNSSGAVYQRQDNLLTGQSVRCLKDN